jgi:hypothetical protein
MGRGLVCVIEWKEFMTELQFLLNQEAFYANNGLGESEERKQIHTIIRLKREGPAPYCLGDDDCSTLALSTCAWRMDCGV